MSRFLTWLAVDGNVAASTQNQALSALLFLYRDMLEIDLPWLRPPGVERVRLSRRAHGGAAPLARRPAETRGLRFCWRDLSAGDTRIYLDREIRRGGRRSCGKVKQERLGWLADNPFYTKRFAWFVGRRCRASTLRDVAKELRRDWKTVKDLEKQYRRALWRRAQKPRPASANFGLQCARVTKATNALATLRPS